MKRLLTLTVLLSLPLTAAGDVPRILIHQGYVTDSDGNPVDGTLPMSVALYSCALCDNALVFEEDLGQVTVRNGFYVVEIGHTANLLTLFQSFAELYLEVRIAGEKGVPRHRLGSVPFALVAEDAVGDIHPNSIWINGSQIIDASGSWVGDPDALPGLKSITAQEPLTGGTITSSGSIGIGRASSSSDGYLAREDFAAFSAKQEAISGSCADGTFATGLNGGAFECRTVGAAQLNGVVPVAGGGTGATDPVGARASLGAAAAGANSDITSLSGLTTPLSAAQGGTGLSGYAAGDLLVASGANTLSRLAAVAAGNVLLSGGVGAAPAYGKVNLAAGGHVTGVLPVAHGGTGSSTQNFVDLSSNQTIGGSKTFSGTVATSASFNYTTDRTGYVAVAAAAFLPRSSSYGYDSAYNGSYRYLLSGGGTELQAPVSLPHGVTMSDFSCHLLDNDATHEIAIGMVDILGNMWVCGPFFTSGQNSVIQTLGGGCSMPVVDNSSRIYYLRFFLQNGNTCGDRCRIYGCRITYTYTSEGR